VAVGMDPAQEEIFHEVADDEDDEGRKDQTKPEVAREADNGKGNVRAQHVECGMRDAQHVHHAEDDREADGHDEQEHAVNDPVQHVVDDDIG